MKKKQSGTKDRLTKEQLRDEIEDLAELLNIDTSSQARDIVEQDSPINTRQNMPLNDAGSEQIKP
jgi:hypothetical protein